MSMLDPTLQGDLERLTRSTRTRRRWRSGKLPAAILLAFAVGALAGWQGGALLRDEGVADSTSDSVGRLIAYTALTRNIDPITLLQAVELHVGKPQAEFSPSDQLKAIDFISNRLPWPQPEIAKAPPTAARF